MENRRVAVRGIIIKDGKLLGVRLNKYPGKATNDSLDYWCTPGGGVDVGEPLIPALEREIIEEVGVAPKVGALLYIQQFQYNGWEHLEFFFHVTNAADYENINLAETTHGALEIAEIDFIDPKKHVILPKFLTQVDVVADVKNGKTQIFNYLSA